MDEKNLWGNLEEIKIVKTPTAIVKEQAAILRAKTKGILMGSVVQVNAPKGWFAVRLDIEVPALNYYTYSVASILHPVKLYPVRRTIKVVNTKNIDILLFSLRRM